MEFFSGLLWGTGISLGLCVGLVAWALLRTGLEVIGYIPRDNETSLSIHRKSLQCLQERNRLTILQIAALERIGKELEDW